MRTEKSLLVITLMFGMAGTLVSAGAQQTPTQTPTQQDTSSGPGWGYMMGPGMMGYGPMGPGMMGQNGGGLGMMGWGGRGAAMCTMMAGHIDGRLAYLKAELKITDAQESLWTAYANAARDNAQGMLTRCTAMMGQGAANALALPDRLDQHEQFMAAQLDALRTLNKTVKPLYAALSDTQKQAANQLMWGPMGMM